MARKAKIMHNIHRKKLVIKFSAKRNELLKKIKDPNTSFEEKQACRVKLDSLPRNSHPNRVRNRCNLTGRPRSVYRKFGLSRLSFREMALKGEVPGVTKASW